MPARRHTTAMRPSTAHFGAARGNHRFKPVPGVRTYGVTRTAGAYKGTLSNWLVDRLSQYSETTERQTIAGRAQDLVANDAHAASTIDSMALNTVGTGLTPQSNPNLGILGWSEEQGRAFQTQAEWSFTIWSREADARGRLPFWLLQYLSIYSMLVNGEFIRIPVMLDHPGRTFSLALQCISPLRVYTPQDFKDKASIRDGVSMGRLGEPEHYWIANPDDACTSWELSSRNFSRIPAWAGHRPGILHGFIPKDDEQVRGISILAPAMKFFRDLSDYLDFELVGAIVAASFPVFIETSDAFGAANGFRQPGSAQPDLPAYQEVNPGQVMYGSQGQKPHVLEANRPGNSFGDFVERILRAVGAACGMPYEVVAKDFSKTNYSSARAALLEAWRVFSFYQKWLVDSFCQPVWEMVLEEAWLRGMIELPKGSPDWYRARHALTRAQWIPPKRGHVDPLKEIQAAILGKEHNLLTLASLIAEFGGDWEAVLPQRAREREMEREKGIQPPQATVKGLGSGGTQKESDEDDGAQTQTPQDD